MNNVIVNYIRHSSYLVETENAYLLFDYIGGALEEFDKDKKIYVFATHNHEDHYQKDIFKLEEKYDEVKYILSDDIRFMVDKNVEEENILFVVPNKEYVLDDLKITTLKSTDQGVAFFVETKDCNVYHAGDLNDWAWPGQNFLVNEYMDNLYINEVRKLKDKKIDIAFVPLDGRLEENYYLGMVNFLKQVTPKYLFPMHMWEMYEYCDVFEKEYSDLLNDTKFNKINKEGQQFILKGDL